MTLSCPLNCENEVHVSQSSDNDCLYMSTYIHVCVLTITLCMYIFVLLWSVWGVGHFSANIIGHVIDWPTERGTLALKCPIHLTNGAKMGKTSGAKMSYNLALKCPFCWR